MLYADQDLKQKVLDGGNDYFKFLFENLQSEKRKEFLIFGEGTSAEYLLILQLKERGWKGIWVYDGEPRYAESLPQDKVIVAQLAQDPRIIKSLDGFYRKTLTIQDIFMQYPGPYGFISACNTGKDRMIWYDARIQDSLPQVYTIGEDGHNEEVVNRLFDKGYKPYVCGDYFVMVKNPEPVIQ